jgi:hypothetical protein
MFRRTTSRGFDFRADHRGFIRIPMPNANHPHAKKSPRMVDGRRHGGKASC